jgi:hypothetical protein
MRAVQAPASHISNVVTDVWLRKLEGRPHQRFISLDFRTQDWYTRVARASHKRLILLTLLKRRGNPSLSATPSKTLEK